jgi:BlaI family transcriptional regulator, penicillinase repressor
MKELTKAQEEILNVLWDIKEGVVADVLDKLPEPKPAYNTVSTVVKVLERKGYVSHKVYGKTHVYYPIVARKDYAGQALHGMFEGFFNNSLSNVVSFFAKQKDEITLQELEELKQYVENEIKKQQQKE